MMRIVDKQHPNYCPNCGHDLRDKGVMTTSGSNINISSKWPCPETCACPHHFNQNWITTCSCPKPDTNAPANFVC